MIVLRDKLTHAMLIVLAFILISGCQKSDRETNSGSIVTPMDPLIGSDNPTLVINENDASGERKAGETQFHPVDVEALEQQIRNVDWDRVEHGPEVILSHDLNKDSLRVHGLFQPDSQEDEIELEVSYQDMSGAQVVLTCKSIESLDQIVAIFKSYYLNDELWRMMVTWRSEK